MACGDVNQERHIMQACVWISLIKNLFTCMFCFYIKLQQNNISEGSWNLHDFNSAIIICGPDCKFLLYHAPS